MIPSARLIALIVVLLLVGIVVFVFIRQVPSKTAATAIANPTPRPLVPISDQKNNGHVSSIITPIAVNKHSSELSRIQTGSINGVVVDVKGLPVPGAFVSIEANENANAHKAVEVECQKGGAFELLGLPEGTCHLQVRSPFENRPVDVTGSEVVLAAGEQREGIRLICGFDASVKFSGRVVDSKNAAIQGATVDIQMPSKRLHSFVWSDDEGIFEMWGLLAGEYDLRVYHADYSRTESASIEIPNAGIQIVLIRKVTIAGRVLDKESGLPIANFSIYPIPGETNSVNAGSYYRVGQPFNNEQGHFEVQGDLGNVTLCVQSKGYAPAFHVVQSVQENETTAGIEIRMEKGAAVEGIVTNARGEPLEGANVYLGENTALVGVVGGQQRPATTKTDSAGKFRLDSLPPGPLQLHASTEGYASAVSLATLNTHETAFVEIVLEMGGGIEGTVTVGGMPAIGYRVELVGSQPLSGTPTICNVTRDGKYHFSDLPPGEITLSVSGALTQSYRVNQLADVIAGETATVDFDLGSGSASIEGTITRDGVPVRDARIYLKVSNGSSAPERATARTDANGAYRIENLQPGAASMTVGFHVEGQERGEYAYQIQLEDRKTLRYDVDLGVGAQILGNVEGIQVGWEVVVILVRGTVQVRDADEFDDVAENADAITELDVGEDGTFQINEIQEGEYTVVVVAWPEDGTDESEGKFAAASVKVERDHVLPVEVVLN